jgi:peroxiredoxin
MTWVYFEESDRQVAAPAFSLERVDGGKVSLQDYYEKACLVALFLPEGNLPGTQAAIDRFTRRQQDIEREGGAIVSVLPVSEPGTEMALPEDPPPFPLLLDHGGQVRGKYAGQMVEDLVPPGSALCFILDVFGAPWAAYIGPSLDEDSLVEDVLSWLAFIGIQCPE